MCYIIIYVLTLCYIWFEVMAKEHRFPGGFLTQQISEILHNNICV